MLVRLLTALITRVETATGAGLLVAEADGKLRQVAAVGVAEAWDRAQISSQSGPLIDAVISDNILMRDPLELSRYPGLASLVDLLPKDVPAAILVVPNSWTSGAYLVTTLYASAPLADADLELVGQYEPLLAYALGLLEYCGHAETQAEHMVRMVQTRRAIEQAKGMIMTRRGVGSDEAFAVLAEHSQRSNVKVRELSEALVDLICNADVDGHSEKAVTAAKSLWEDVSS